jgi:hypothetical protein
MSRRKKNKKLNNYTKYYSIIRIVWLSLAIIISEVLNLYCESSQVFCACRDTTNLLGIICYTFSLTYTLATIYVLLPISTLVFITLEVVDCIIAFSDKYNLEKLKVMRVFSIIFITAFIIVFLLSTVIIGGSVNHFYILPAVLISLIMEIIHLVILNHGIDELDGKNE